MAMWLKQAVLVLLSVAEATMMGYPQEIILSSPGDQSHKERVNTSARSLKFLCDIPTSLRYRVTFYFRDSNKKNISLNCSTMINENSSASTTSPKQKQMNQTEPNMKCYNKTWEIQNITRENNGFYSCEIQLEIPVLTTIESMEVEVSFVPSGNGTSFENNLTSSLWFWPLLGLSSLFVVILMVLCVIIRRACLRNEDTLDPVYANTHRKIKDRSPRPPHAPRPDQLKLAEPYENLRTPSPSRRRKRLKTHRSHSGKGTARGHVTGQCLPPSAPPGAKRRVRACRWSGGIPRSARAELRLSGRVESRTMKMVSCSFHHR
ncbi:hypothetical protein OJAV_G00037110 [Oryzias javanicus]|uniref:Immunoglobulin subtype domain-containing protein n=1 Tax=Oryzias javanicus TaxID=123683 RepID=A0A437DGM7_ORYJA|nr:hypothetical protein OJAV_G00037110 [Oryzias javanicus]